MNAKQAFEFMDGKLSDAFDIHVLHEFKRKPSPGCRGKLAYIGLYDEATAATQIFYVQDESDFEPAARAALDWAQNRVIAMRDFEARWRADSAKGVIRLFQSVDLSKLDLMEGGR